MKAGDKVKVRVDKTWRAGTVQGLKSPMKRGEPTVVTVAVGEPHYFNYEVKDFPQTDVKRYEPVTEDKEAENALLAPTVLEAANQALADLLPTETAELKEGVVSAYYGAVTLEPCTYEQETIGAFREIAGWSVTVWRHFPATRHSPEEMSDSPIGSFPNYAQAIQKFVETVFACKAEDYWQHKADEAMAEAWAAGEM